MNKKLTQQKSDGFLYFPLGKMAKEETIFKDDDKRSFRDEYRLILKPILGKQLAVNTYYKNDLIALANTRITMGLLRIFDEFKINFKVNQIELTEEERNHALDSAMVQIMKIKRDFFNTLEKQEIPAMQNTLKGFLGETMAGCKMDRFHAHDESVAGFLAFANSAITSQDRYVGTAMALKKIIDNEKRILGLGESENGETIDHVVKTTWISLMLARQLDDFDDADCKILSVICMGHDGGKVLVPDEILYKKGRLTQLENDIMKSHVLLSYLFASNNQQDLNFESFAMALHHVKENKSLPQSYGIIPDTHTSFYEYLTPEARIKLNEIYHLTKKYYRLISLADTFEAIASPRIYKRASSIGATLLIMVNSHQKDGLFYPPYLDAFVSFWIQEILPRNLKFRINDEILDLYCNCKNVSLTLEQKEHCKENYLGAIINSCSTLKTDLDCVVFDPETRKVKFKLAFPPMVLLKDFYF
jgi:HD-GYP domain-containing protein (c-di-GMP phosphodiesterase class II)